MPEFPETNDSLIARVHDLGDGVSWGEFVGLYEPVVLRMARRRGLQEADANDVAQRVFLSVARSIERFCPGPDRPPFRAWLTTIARNAITDSLSRCPRDRATGSSSVAELLASHPQPGDGSSEITAEEKISAVRWAVEQVRSDFTELTWKIFWLTAVEGRPVAEVSKQTGRTPGSIYVSNFRVVSRMKSRFSEISRLWAFEEHRS